MKVITWNCNMAFRKKASFILEHKPDILVVPECEHPDKLLFEGDVQKPTQSIWFGKNLNKGIGIFSFNGYELKVLKNYKDSLRYIIPISVSHSTHTYNLFAIWANNVEDKEGRYVEQIWKSLDCYDKFISGKNTMLIGDFNSNTIWDKEHKLASHSLVVKRLAEKGIHSSYHLYQGQIQGSEKHPTLYMYRKQGKSYHIDYCFVSSDLADRIDSVKIGEFDPWAKYSDHVPLIVSFRES